jgi:hypothetical protein
MHNAFFVHVAQLALFVQLAHPLSAGGISWRSVSISGALAELALERQAGDQPTLEQGAGFQPILAPARGCGPYMG